LEGGKSGLKFLVAQQKSGGKERIKTQKLIKKTRPFLNFYGGDLSDTTNLKTKEDCRERLEAHRKLMEDMLSDAMAHLNDFERELGIY